MKSGSLNLLETSGLVQACAGITLPFTKICHKCKVYHFSKQWPFFSKNIAVHRHYVCICLERFRLRLKPRMHHFLSFIITGRSSSSHGFLVIKTRNNQSYGRIIWVGRIELQLPGCWKGSCRGMRTRVIAEQELPMDSTPLRFLRIAGFIYDFNILLLRYSSHSCALLLVMFQCRPIAVPK